VLGTSVAECIKYVFLVCLLDCMCASARVLLVVCAENGSLNKRVEADYP
jgi:hypothetical protein